MCYLWFYCILFWNEATPRASLTDFDCRIYFSGKWSDKINWLIGFYGCSYEYSFRMKFENSLLTWTKSYFRGFITSKIEHFLFFLEFSSGWLLKSVVIVYGDFWSIGIETSLKAHKPPKSSTSKSVVELTPHCTDHRYMSKRNFALQMCPIF